MTTRRTRLAQIYVSEKQKGGGLTTTLYKGVKEKIDPRQIFDQRGLLAAIMPQIFKAYRATPTRQQTALETNKLQRKTADIQKQALDVQQETLDVLTNSNSVLVSMAKDMRKLTKDSNITRQNTYKTLKLMGGKPSSSADKEFRELHANEAALEAYESKTPTPIKEESKFGMPKDVGEMFDKITPFLKGAVGIIAVIGGVAGLAKLYTTIKEFDSGKLLEQIKTGFTNVVEWFKDLPDKLSKLTLGDIESGINTVIDQINQFYKKMTHFANELIDIVDALEGMIDTAYNKIVDITISLKGIFGKDFGNSWMPAQYQGVSMGESTVLRSRETRDERNADENLTAEYLKASEAAGTANREKGTPIPEYLLSQESYKRWKLEQERNKNHIEEKGLLSPVKITTDENKDKPLFTRVGDWFSDTAERASLSLQAVRGERVDERTVMDFLTKHGLTAEQAAGITGNLKAESGLDTGKINPNDKGKVSFGLAQWRGSRLEALEQFAKQQGKDITDANTQLEFLWNELQTTEQSAFNSLKLQNSASSSANDFFTNFERGAKDGNYENRIQFSKNVLERYKGFQPISNPTSGSTINQQTTEVNAMADKNNTPNVVIDAKTINNGGNSPAVSPRINPATPQNNDLIHQLLGI